MWLSSIFMGHEFRKTFRITLPFPSCLPSGKRLHNYMERSTMLLMAKSTISTGPFSLSQTLSFPKGTHCYGNPLKTSSPAQHLLNLPRGAVEGGDHRQDGRGTEVRVLQELQHRVTWHPPSWNIYIYIYIYMCGYIMGILIVGRVEKDGISSCFFCRSPMNCYFRSPNTGVQFVLSTFHPEIKTLKLSLISPKEPGSRMDGTSEIKKNTKTRFSKD